MNIGEHRHNKELQTDTPVPVGMSDEAVGLALIGQKGRWVYYAFLVVAFLNFIWIEASKHETTSALSESTVIPIVFLVVLEALVISQIVPIARLMWRTLGPHKSWDTAVFLVLLSGLTLVAALAAPVVLFLLGTNMVSWTP